MSTERRTETFTIDTSCVIAATRGESDGVWVDQLVSLARQGRVSLCLAVAFDADMMRASKENRAANLEWLAGVPVLQTAPGPFRLGYSMLGGPDVLVSDSQAATIGTIEKIILPAGFHTGRHQDSEDEFNVRWNRKLNDVQHLAAHAMANNDVFVTSDFDDILSKTDELFAEARITVCSPRQSVTRLAAQ